MNRKLQVHFFWCFPRTRKRCKNRFNKNTDACVPALQCAVVCFAVFCTVYSVCFLLSSLFPDQKRLAAQQREDAWEGRGAELS